MKIRVYGSTSNLGAGFDTLGLAVNIFNEFEVKPSNEFSVSIEGYGKELANPESNLFIRAFKRTYEFFGKEIEPIKLHQINNIPVARGLGSSATAIVGGIETACILSETYLSLREKLNIAFEFEPHPDNLLPSFLGGFVVSCDCNGNFLYQRLPFPEELKIVFVIPEIKVSTEEARKILPKTVPFHEAVGNVQRVSLFISSLINKDYEALKYAVEDNLHEPYRKRLIPGYEEIKETCYETGAKAVFISGSGPTICILTLEREEELGEKAVEIFLNAGIRSHYVVAEPSKIGFSVEIL